MSAQDGLLEQLRQALSQSWSADTSAECGNWNPDNASLGHCAVTACIVQDLLGGEIVWAFATTPDASRHSHYFNRLADGTVLDLTRAQFPPGTNFSPLEGCTKTNGADGRSFANTRDYVLSYSSTQQRYEQLRSKVRCLLGH